jgi:hypothetical protein
MRCNHHEPRLVSTAKCRKPVLHSVPALDQPALDARQWDTPLLNGVAVAIS